MVAVIIERGSTVGQQNRRLRELDDTDVFLLSPTTLRYRKRFRSIDLGILSTLHDDARSEQEYDDRDDAAHQLWSSTVTDSSSTSFTTSYADDSSHYEYSAMNHRSSSCTDRIGVPSTITNHSPRPISPLSPHHHHFRSHYRLISPEHPLKILWDVCTLLLSLVNAYLTHVAIRDRSFGWNFYDTKFFTELWFAADILLNFVTEHPLDSHRRLVTISSVSARYLVTWFWIDVLSLLPGETLFVQPVLLRLQRRRFRWLRRFSRIFQWTRRLLGNADFRKLTRHVTKHQGLRATTRLTRFCIRYIPKYWLFIRNMKAVIGLRLLRQVHWVHKILWRTRRWSNASSVSVPVVPMQVTQEEEEYDPF